MKQVRLIFCYFIPLIYSFAQKILTFPSYIFTSTLINSLSNLSKVFLLQSTLMMFFHFPKFLSSNLYVNQYTCSLIRKKCEFYGGFRFTHFHCKNSGAIDFSQLKWVKTDMSVATSLTAWAPIKNDSLVDIIVIFTS